MQPNDRSGPRSGRARLRFLVGAVGAAALVVPLTIGTTAASAATLRHTTVRATSTTTTTTDPCVVKVSPSTFHEAGDAFNASGTYGDTGDTASSVAYVIEVGCKPSIGSENTVEIDATSLELGLLRRPLVVQRHG